MKKLAIIALLLVMFGPAGGLLAIGVLMNPAGNATCTTTHSPGIGLVPDELTATTSTGTTITFNRTQLAHAATIITIGNTTPGISRDAIIIALMAALTESNLRMLANTSTYPDSANYPHDGNGSDHDSLGLFQMRPQSGWGTIAELMDPTYQARAFYGGPTGPNHGSPRGLLDIPGWETLDKGAAAQAVEVSAYPDRYATFERVAETIHTALTTTPTSNTRGGTAASNGQIVFPLPEGTWIATSGYGPRTHPVTGQTRTHTGTDYAAPAGTPIMAIADGVVTFAGPAGGYGNLITINHTIAGQPVTSAYAHMWNTGIHVHTGDHVAAGQHIGDVGSAGMSTGAHLHLEIRPDAGTATNAETWLTNHPPTHLTQPGITRPARTQTSGCATTPAGGQAVPVAGDPDRMVPDPTTRGHITASMHNVYTQTLAQFPNTAWSCYSPRPGTKSEHPLGRACDITFGNQIGTRPTPQQLAHGWQVTNWAKTNATTLGIDYLIWQGQIWSIARDTEGWRPYNGGGMHNPNDITGGHYDHLHITVK